MSLMERLRDWDSFTEWEPANNDLDPTESDPLDYAPFWDTEPEWWYPHPDMDGYTCSTGFRHVARPVLSSPPVGLARIQDLPLASIRGAAGYPREEE